MLIHPGNASPEFRTLFDRFPGARLARPDDSAALSNFFNATAMSTNGFNFGFTRGEDYFSLPSLQSDRFATLVCEENNSIVGVGAVSMRKGFVRGKKQSICYLQDLRLIPTASARMRQTLYALFCEFVRVCPSLSDFDNCSVFLTAILNDNAAARSALSRPSFPLEYVRLAQYKAHVWPKLSLWPKHAHRAEMNLNSKETALLAFYESQLGKLGFDLTTDDIIRLQNHSTPVVVERNAEIQAACLLVDTSAERRIRSQYAPLGWAIETSGTYITAFRVKRSASHLERASLERTLMRKALRTSQGLPGNFTGFIETENALHKGGAWRTKIRFSIAGGLYRVFHPEHLRLDNFQNGFLRPAHTAAFDWVMS
ncbi:MAG: hypothetical protein FJY29_12670 [Betaproteobacteria bacterium]|nr:hypothetical protein [Betaproteobacteria bacterium]